MRCSTCGETFDFGAARCPTCGTAAPAAAGLVRDGRVRRCPRCGYHGEGIAYFRRVGHVCLLAGVSLFTYGLGGLVYWLARRRHLVCPRCGLGWEAAAPTPAAPAVAGAGPGAGAPREADEPLPSGGLKRRVLGVALVLGATALVLVGFVEWEMAAVAVGSAVGAGGSLTFLWGWMARQERREAVLRALQRRILRLAQAKGGTLTVTEVAADVNLSLPAAEKVLTSMDDGFRVRSEISPEGVLYYEFPEVRHRRELGSGG